MLVAFWATNHAGGPRLIRFSKSARSLVCEHESNLPTAKMNESFTRRAFCGKFSCAELTCTMFHLLAQFECKLNPTSLCCDATICFHIFLRLHTRNVSNCSVKHLQDHWWAHSRLYFLIVMSLVLHVCLSVCLSVRAIESNFEDDQERNSVFRVWKCFGGTSTKCMRKRVDFPSHSCVWWVTIERFCNQTVRVHVDVDVDVENVRCVGVYVMPTKLLFGKPRNVQQRRSAPSTSCPMHLQRIKLVSPWALIRFCSLERKMVASTTRKFFCLFFLSTRSQVLFLENFCTNYVYKW